MHSDTPGNWQLVWPHGTACIKALGGMLGPVYFRLSEERHFQPFYVAPWACDPALPGLLRSMRGEWPCVPFSRVETPTELAPGWTIHRPEDPAYQQIHGPGANQEWQLLERDANRIVLGIDYPADSAIASLRREIKADPHSPALEISLRILPRAATIMPVALHPTFRVPKEVGSLSLRPGTFARAVTFPTPFEPSSQLAHSKLAHDLAALPGLNGGTHDFSHLPMAQPCEELLQLVDCDGEFALHYQQENVVVTLNWDASQLPDAVLWISNGGRDQAPWLGRNFALGIEPVNGVFELGGVVQPPAGHLLAGRGLQLHAGKPVTLQYRISVAAGPGQSDT